MRVEQNVGGRDRQLRVVLTVVFALVAVVAARRNRRVLAAFAGLGALGTAINAATCFCGLNAALGIDTTSDDADW